MHVAMEPTTPGRLINDWMLLNHIAVQHSVDIPNVRLALRSLILAQQVSRLCFCALPMNHTVLVSSCSNVVPYLEVC